MNPVELIQRIYKEMELDIPEVVHYDSFLEAVEDFPNWKGRLKRFAAVLWDYQYPVLHPSSYWAQCHLFDEGFQFDLKRSPNEYGCYVTPHYVSKIPIEAKHLHGRYLRAALDAHRSRDGIIDKAIEMIMDEQEDFIDQLYDMLEDEDPTNQAPIESYVFLGSFDWVCVEYEILRDMRAWIQKPVCDEHFQNVKNLKEYDGLFMTFRDFVISTPIPKNFEQCTGGLLDINEIKFYRVDDKFGCFSNFSAHPIFLNGTIWPTSEHYFQAQKFKDYEIQQKIRSASSPMIAAELGRNRNFTLRPDWEDIKDDIMRKAVKAKVMQHSDVREVLLSTGTAKIFEHTKNDNYWGDGGDKSGKNMLGIILMEIRDGLTKNGPYNELSGSLPPPWIKYPKIERYSIGWRMGYGEDFLMEWWPFYGGLSIKGRKRYQELYPEPEEWNGFYREQE